MMKEALLSKVAEGFYRSAIENKAVSIYREDLKFFSWNLKTNPDYFKFLKSPFIDYKDKCKSLDDLFGEVFVKEMMAFVKILITKELIGDIDQIRKIFNRLADKDANILEGKVYTPFELSKEQINRLSTAFNEKLDKGIILKQVVDNTLIGGIKVILDGIVYEYSINSTLEQAKENLVNKLNNGEEVL